MRFPKPVLAAALTAAFALAVSTAAAIDTPASTTAVAAPMSPSTPSTLADEYAAIRAVDIDGVSPSIPPSEMWPAQ